MTSPRVVAIPARLRLVQLKILHRVYVTGPRLVQMGRAEGGGCRRCCGQTGTFMHILWECIHTQSYWRKIHDIISEVLTIILRPEAHRCLLNIWEPTDLNTYHTQWATLGLMLAKRNIAQLWGGRSIRQQWRIGKKTLIGACTKKRWSTRTGGALINGLESGACGLHTEGRYAVHHVV